MKHILSASLLLLLSLVCDAQNVSVASFSLDEKDLTANQQGTIVLDQNGEKCALIKVKTTQQGFVFDVGSLGVQKTEQKIAEVWVYVPHGARKMNISHQLLGQMDYDFPVTLGKAKTYVMQLTTGEVQTVVKNAVTAQYVMFRLNPKNALVEINGETLETTDGVATKRVPFGTYGYKVQAPRYASQTGSVTVNDPKNKHTIDVSLVPQFSTFTFVVKNDAEIWIDGEKKGNGTCKVELGYGSCLIETKLAGHRNVQLDINLTKELASAPIQLEAPRPIYGSLDINSAPADADIWMDGKNVGTTPMFIDEVLVGAHNIKIAKQGYNDCSVEIVLKEGDTKEVKPTLVKGDSYEETVFVARDIVPEVKAFNVRGVSFKMIKVRAGTFLMGSENDTIGGQEPHSVMLTQDYYIGETEVTQALWKAVTGYSPTVEGKSWTKRLGLGDDYPAYYISYEDVLSFIEKLNKLTGENFRLPTEAEWEYASKGGTSSKNYIYSGSDVIEDVAWYCVNSKDKGTASPDYGTHRVGTKAANEIGLYDMSGNVWEWCSDWYGSYRVVRGGSWGIAAACCSSANRSYGAPAYNNNNLGVRLALSFTKQ